MVPKGTIQGHITYNSIIYELIQSGWYSDITKQFPWKPERGTNTHSKKKNKNLTDVEKQRYYLRDAK